MTDGTARALAALVAALVCVAGGSVAFGLAQWMRPPPPPDVQQVIDQVMASLQPNDPSGIDSALPPNASALVFQSVEPVAAPVPASSASTTASARTMPSATTTPSSEPKADVTGPGAGRSTVLPRPTEPSPAQAVWSERTLLVFDGGQYSAELARLSATSVVAERRRDGIVLAVATPRTDRPSRTAPAVAGVAALTGVLAALAIVLLWPPGRREVTPMAPDEPTGRHGGPQPPWAGPAAGLGAPGRGVAVLPDPRGAVAVPPGTDGAAPQLPRAVTTIEPPPPDPVPALRTERATLIKGLADLAAKLPADYEWQAANALDAAGVRRILPDGDVFDPASHYAVDTVPTPDTRLHDTVARTLRPGWADGEHVVLPARVVVYAAPPQEEGPDDGVH